MSCLKSQSSREILRVHLRFRHDLSCLYGSVAQFLKNYEMALDFNKWTVKAQDALNAARDVAVEYQQQEMDVEHLLLALLRQTDGTTAPLLGKIGASPQAMARDLEGELSKRPKVAGVEPATIL